MQIETGQHHIVLGAPDSFIAELKRELTFPNPQYAKLGVLGKRRWHVPKTLCYLKDIGYGRFIVPRGVDVARKADEYGLRYNHREFTLDSPCRFLLEAELRDYQADCLAACEGEDQGYIVAPTGAGKSVIGCALIAQKQQRALIVVHTKELLSQWRSVLKRFLGVEAGVLGGGKKRQGRVATVASVQTLARMDLDQVRDYGIVLVDECHHVPASTWTSTIDRLPARYRFGLSATPKRRDGMQFLLPVYFGKKLADISRSTVMQAGGIIDAQVFKFDTSCWPGSPDWQGMVSGLVEDEARSRRIATFSARASGKCPTLVLTDRIGHAERLCEIAGEGAVLLHGKLKKSDRDEAFKRIRQGASLTVATTSIIGEGIDVSGWQCLVLALPMSGKGSRLTQAIGRLVRPAEGKEIAHVIDYVDEHPMALNAWKSRRSTYRRLKMEVKEGQ